MHVAACRSIVSPCTKLRPYGSTYHRPHFCLQTEKLCYSASWSTINPGVTRSCAFGDTGTSKVKVRVSKTAGRAVKAKAALCAAVYSAVVEKGYTGIRCCNSIGYQRAVARTDLMAAHEHRFSSRLRVGTVALAMKPNK